MRFGSRRFIRTYEQFLASFDRGAVYISKKHIGKVFDLWSKTT